MNRFFPPLKCVKYQFQDKVLLNMSESLFGEKIIMGILGSAEIRLWTSSPPT